MATESNGKEKTVYEDVVMSDGSTVKFAGKRKLDKTVTVDEAAGSVSVKFAFRNGQILVAESTKMPALTQLLALGHGVSQKCGDEVAGTEKVEDMVPAVQAMIERLYSGDWRAERAAGDSFAGTHVVVRAIAEVKGKTVEEVKAFLNKKLEDAKAANQSLSRQELYAAFRKPGTATAAVIARIEAEDASKSSKVDASDLLAEIA